MIFKHCSLIQEGEAALFYRFNRPLNGYMIAGVIIAPKISAKIDFIKIWRYFVSEVVRSNDIYASLITDKDDSIFGVHATFHTDMGGRKIYKIDNSYRDLYSTYSQHLKEVASG